MTVVKVKTIRNEINEPKYSTIESSSEDDIETTIILIEIFKLLFKMHFSHYEKNIMIHDVITPNP